MNSLVPLLVVLVAATAFGIWFQRTRGEFRRKKTINGPRMTADQIGIALGERVTSWSMGDEVMGIVGGGS